MTSSAALVCLVGALMLALWPAAVEQHSTGDAEFGQGTLVVHCGPPVFAFRADYRTSGDAQVALPAQPLLPASPECGRKVAGRLSGAVFLLLGSVAALAAAAWPATRGRTRAQASARS